MVEYKEKCILYYSTTITSPLKWWDKRRRKLSLGLSPIASILNIYCYEHVSTKMYPGRGNNLYQLQDLIFNKTKMKSFETVSLGWSNPLYLLQYIQISKIVQNKLQKKVDWNWKPCNTKLRTSVGADKLLLKYDLETLQVKDCMIKWIQNVKGQLICNNGNINGR